MKVNSFILVFLFIAFLAIACQGEENEIVQDASNNFTRYSPISGLISRVSQYETSKDNILDSSSNFSVKLPVGVTVNNTYVHVASSADFQTVSNIKNQSNSDDDVVYFSYPITLIFSNYREQTVSNQAQFVSILESYGDDGTHQEISCINFNYPFSINYYDANSQIGNTIIVHDDRQLNNFINTLSASDIVRIAFPITLIDSSMQPISIANNTQLEDVINNAVASCLNPLQPLALSEVLTDGNWYISYCFQGSDETEEYTGFNFEFHPGGAITVRRNSTVFEGDWDVDDGVPQRLDLNFDGSLLHDIETNWDVQEFTQTYIRLREHGGGQGSQSFYLSLTKL